MMDRPFHRFFALQAAGKPAALFASFLVAAFLVSPIQAATPSATQALGLKPIQKNVELMPVQAEDVTVRDIESKKMTGWEVVSQNGSILRRFADTNGDKKMDLWCYFNNGVAVYQDIDENYNGRPDQYRWLGTLGSRWGIDTNEDGEIDRWKQISPEEVTAEVVAALRDGDENRFAALVLSPKELAGLGLGKEQTIMLGQKAERALKDFAGLAKRQKAIGPRCRVGSICRAHSRSVASGNRRIDRRCDGLRKCRRDVFRWRRKWTSPGWYPRQNGRSLANR